MNFSDVRFKTIKQAVARVEQLLPLVDDTTPRTDPNSIELELLSNLVADYSEKHFSIGKPCRGDVIKMRMAELGITQAKLAEILGISAAILLSDK